MSGPSQYDTPDGPGDEATPGADDAAVEFTTPDPSAVGEASFQASADVLSGVSSDLLTARDEVENALRSQSRSSKLQTVEAFTASDSNIQGVAIGLGEPGEGPPGQPTLQIYVAEATTPDSVRSTLASSMGVQSAQDSSLPITVRKSGVFDALAHRFRIRPAPGGVSAGHFRVTAGTLGCLATGRSAPRTSRLLMLSNNHVLANSNNAAGGDCITQPGNIDGGRCPADQIAILERFVPIRFGGPSNFVDCATGWCWPDRVRRELVYLSGGQIQLFRIGSNPTWPTLGMLVGKSGRTTQLTQGRVVALNWSGWINYGVGNAFFTGQVVVQGASSTPFSAGGDSGSVIWEWASGLRPVGLLFAGGGGLTIANPMPWVVSALDINLVT
ncbi:MAG: FIG00497627: hypothetical protein [uncultured Pseudonocardia sp.]|uniref:Peptidase S1 domain-containing protein n=1 Tax=uncultured Pseudonocardia sp. TaxID=211455 RepID=A0A6J4PT31_9PSEU|nr:MAG: FIG00497627: hypothetical protein [uncultured Pseudonocardia sp.]